MIVCRWLPTLFISRMFVGNGPGFRSFSMQMRSIRFETCVKCRTIINETTTHKSNAIRSISMRWGLAIEQGKDLCKLGLSFNKLNIKQYANWMRLWNCGKCFWQHLNPLWLLHIPNLHTTKQILYVRSAPQQQQQQKQLFRPLWKFRSTCRASQCHLQDRLPCHSIPCPNLACLWSGPHLLLHCGYRILDRVRENECFLIFSRKNSSFVIPF